MIYLASSGDEAKIWDVPTFTLREQFNPFQASVSDLTWSHDGYSIASCCNSDNTVYLRQTKTAQSIPSDSFVLPAGCQCLDYNSSSRFLLCGCVDGSVHIWDRKSKAIKKSHTNLKHPVTVARWNWNDTYISLGLENGNIILYNVATGQASSPLVASSTVRQLKYNPYHKSSMVSVSDDGAVNFWDTNTRRLVHAFTKTHQAPARDLAFSPINDYLMVSVGLDKRAVFYDVQNKSSVKTVVAEHPLTSVDIMQDGATVVVGTTRGKIFFYDMRQSSVPMFNFTAHKSSVKRLSFVKQDSDKSGSNFSSQSLRRQLPTTPVSSTDAQNQNSNNADYQSPRNNTYHTGLEIFSPLGNANKSSNSVTDKTGSEKSWMHNLTKSHTGDIFTTGEGVFSPLPHDSSYSINSTHNRSSIASNNSFLTQVLGHIESVNKDPVNSHSNSLYTIGEVPVDKITPDTIDGINSLPAKETTSENSPRSLTQRGVRAPPNLQQLSSQRVHDVDSATSSPRTMTSTSSVLQHRVSSGDRPDIPAADYINGTSSHSPRTTHLRFKDNDSPEPFSMTNGATSSSPLRSPSNSQRIRPSSETVLPSSMITSPAILSMRHVVQDLLREQFHEHQEQLKTDIRAMLGHPGYNTLGTSQQSNTASLPSQNNPGIFHAEFIRNLIREELDDMRDFIHKDFWCVQVEMIKQIFQLQKKIEAGFAERTINPILLDEIDRLRQENARLKKTF